MKDMVTRLQLSDLVLQKALELARLVKVRLLVWAPGDGYGSAKENLTFHRGCSIILVVGARVKVLAGVRSLHPIWRGGALLCADRVI